MGFFTGLFDSNLFVPRRIMKELQHIADEVGMLTGKEIDEHELASSILWEFIRIHHEGTVRQTAKIITGFNHQGRNPEEEEYVYRYFRDNGKFIR